MANVCIDAKREICYNETEIMETHIRELWTGNGVYEMPPLSVMIKPVSGACNMRCSYCFYADEMRHREVKLYSRMDTALLETVVRRVIACADESVSFVFQGGEPTLIGLPFFEALVRFERKYNKRGLCIHNAVQSNGYDLSDDMLRFFAKEHFLLGISLDGTQETHDAYRVDTLGQPTYWRIRTAVERMQSYGVEFNVLCVVNAHVARQPKAVFEALAPYGYIQFIACLEGLDGQVQEHSLTQELYLEFLKTTFDLYFERHMQGKPVSVRNFDNYIGILLGMPPENCSMTGHCSTQILIEGDGSVFPCDFYALDAWRLGNIQSDSLRRMLRSDRARAFVEESLPVPEKCTACRWYTLCRNGCKRERNQDGLNRWCDCMQAFFAYSDPKMGKIVRKIRHSDVRR